jgi:two-component system, cell cycle sensor histidine kinase and response regulator CckA
MNGEKRKSGINLIGDIPWGTHFCQFYETKKDLIDILVPYFKAGLQDNEYCMWVTSGPLPAGEARAALKKVVTNLDGYIKKGQIEIVPHDQCYLKDGIFDQQVVLGSWIDKLDRALKQGYEGLRVSGNTAWLEKKDWKSFTEYEEEINRVIGNYRMISICTYSLDRCGTAEVIDVINNHQFALIRRQGQWQMIKSAKHEQMKEALHSSDENFRRSMDDSPLGIRIVTTEGELLYANRAILDIHGYASIEELKTTPRKKSYTPESYAEHQVRKEKRKQGEYVPSNYEISIVRKNGEIRHLEVFRKEVLWNGETQFQVLYHDRTERKRIQDELRIKDNAIDSSINAIAMADLQGKLTYVNLSFLQMWGYDDEKEVLGKLVLEFWETEENAIEVVKTLQKGGGWQGELVARRKGGPTFYAQLSASLVTDDTGKPVCLTASFVDITKCKQVEQRLRGSEEKYRLLIENQQDLVVKTDTEGHLLYINPAYCELFNKTEQELLGTTYMPLVHPEDLPAVEKAVALLFKPPFKCKYEERAETRYGWRWLSWIAQAELNENGEMIALVGTGHDITERKQAEEALQKSRMHYKELAESISDIFFAMDNELRYTYWNKASEELTGISAKDALGKHLYDIFPKDEQTKKAEEAYLKALKSKQPQHFVNEYQLGDKHFFFEISAYPAEDGLTVLIKDITGRKCLEVELLRVEKLESIGTLAGGIAHDFNNILTAILGNITLAERDIEPKGKAAERLMEAKKASLRAKDLTQQLLTFSRGGAPTKEVASIAELLEESALFTLRGSNVKCEFSLPDDLWSIEVDRGQMSQVITNLVINADEAMPEGGLMVIGAKNTVIKRKGALPLPKGDYVEITVEDHGIGILGKYLGRIFDPYFTTKQKGTGLGLATTYSIIKNHDGYITVESEPGVGTTFHIYLPASKKPVTKQGEVEEAVQAASLGRKRILVMDDEETIRDLLSNMLSTAGFEVELASDGKEAIERYEKAMELGQPFDAVIMDLTIPGGMGGKEAIKKLIEIDPDVKAIVSSGYSTDPIMADFRKYGFSAVMAKPYSINEMERTLRRMLIWAEKNHSEE